MHGGWIADRLLGRERTVLYGGVVVMLGHIALAIVPGLGFHYGFGAAAIGIALGLGHYVAFRRIPGAHGRMVSNPLPRSAIGWVVGVLVAAVAVTAVVFVTGMVKLSNLSQVTTGVIVAASLAYFAVRLTSSKVGPALHCERNLLVAVSADIHTTGKAVPAFLVVAIRAIGLSVTTKLAPEAFRAQMMALYFYSVGLGTSMSGVWAR